MKIRIPLLRKGPLAGALFMAVSMASLSFSATVNINQDNADSGDRFTFDAEVDYQLTGSIVFDSYAETVYSSRWGNVFYITDDNNRSFRKNTIKGDSNRSYDLVVSNNIRTFGGHYNQSVYSEGGAIGGNLLIFKDLNSLQVINNNIDFLTTVEPTKQTVANGGGIKAGFLVLSDVNKLVVQNNTITGRASIAQGAGIYASKFGTGVKSDMTNIWDGGFEEGTGTGDIYILNNSCLAQARGQHMYGGGFANLDGPSTFTHQWRNTGIISFRDNKVTYNEHIALEAGRGGFNRFWGGAYYSAYLTDFSNTRNIEFINNVADGSFYTHEVESYGGAIYGHYFRFSQIKSQTEGAPAILFLNNRAIGSNHASSIGNGGAIAVSSVSFKQSGEIVFKDNYASTKGGAINLKAVYKGPGIFAGGSESNFSADEGNITFIGNTDSLSSSFERNSGISNAIHFDEADLVAPFEVYFGAQEGYSVNMYDPITAGALDKDGLIMHFNDGANGDYTGTILFSGAYVRDSLAGSEGSADYQYRVAESKKSEINATIILNNGTLKLEEGVTLGRKYDAANPTDGTGASFYMDELATLDISGSQENGATTLAAQTIDITSKVNDDVQLATIKIGNMSRFDANDITIENGMRLDMGYYFTPNTARQLGISQVDHTGLQITSESLTLGGTLNIADTVDDYFYTDLFWAEDRSFTIFDTVGVDTITGDFDSILSELTGSPVVADPYQRQGEWSLEWVDGQLVANWTSVVSEITEIRPEMDGTAMLNTLWSTASNVQAMGRAGAAQMGVHRFRYGKDHNIWGQGLADFSSHGRRGDRDGYDYNGGGYAVGMDHRMGKHFVTGFGVGQLKGDNRSRGYNIKTSQDTFMGMLYTNYNHQLNKKNNLDIQLIGVYGNTTNKSRTTYNRGVSQGKWDNDAWMLDLYATWTRDLGSNWSLTPYIGLEYTIANQDGFTETGYAARRFNSDKMRNLAMPVGMGVAKLVSFNNGMHWLNELKVSYVPDLYRKNPETEAEWLDQEFTWYAKGVAPVRNAARIEYNSRLQLSQRWSLYGGYMYEGRRNATYHQVNLGASYSF